MIRVIELIRVSTEGQAASDRASIPAQRAINRRTAANYGLQIVRSIEMADVSGTAVLSTPEMQQLLKDIESPDVCGVVAREFSRLMRPENFADYALLQAFADTRTVLYLPEGPIDFNSKTGRLIGTIRAAIAGMERTEILERVWSAKEEKRRRGELAQSHVVLPFGVGYENGRFFYKPEAETVREAFRRFLKGDQCYRDLARLVGVTPRGMHVIMRNPIWIGWRVIDKKRDLSSAGKYLGRNGRQADRRKVARAPEDVIRVKVIDTPLISECEFNDVQQIMDSKQSRHWRSRPEIEHRWIYNGFLTCSVCSSMIHTAFAGRDYYACRGRRTNHTCKTKYMQREKLESILDSVFSQRLTNPRFLEQCIKVAKGQNQKDDSPLRVKRLSAELDSLRHKRERTIDTFIEGVISREGTRPATRRS